VDELIAAARVPVFLLGEHQIVKPGELGTIADIERYALYSTSLSITSHSVRSFVAAGASTSDGCCGCWV
jgi:hypothetical protein